MTFDLSQLINKADLDLTCSPDARASMKFMERGLEAKNYMIIPSLNS